MGTFVLCLLLTQAPEPGRVSAVVLGTAVHSGDAVVWGGGVGASYRFLPSWSVELTIQRHFDVPEQTLDDDSHAVDLFMGALAFSPPWFVAPVAIAKAGAGSGAWKVTPAFAAAAGAQLNVGHVLARATVDLFLVQACYQLDSFPSRGECTSLDLPAIGVTAAAGWAF